MMFNFDSLKKDLKILSENESKLIREQRNPETRKKWGLEIFKLLKKFPEIEKLPELRGIDPKSLEEVKQLINFCKKGDEEFLRFLYENFSLETMGLLILSLEAFVKKDAKVKQEESGLFNQDEILKKIYEAAIQYLDSTELYLSTDDLVKSFALLNKFEQDRSSIFGLSLACANTAGQIIPSWALAIESDSLSLYSVDPAIDCSEKTCARAKQLGVDLRQVKGEQNASNQKGKTSVNLCNSSFPIYFMLGKTPLAEMFFQKFKKILSEKLHRGDTVILGYHAAGVYIDPLIARIFNELKKEQPHAKFLLHVQGGHTNSIYYQDSFDFSKHHYHFRRGKDEGVGQDCNDVGIPYSYLVEALPELRGKDPEPSLSKLEQVPPFIDSFIPKSQNCPH